jgi:hypothetical protein
MSSCSCFTILISYTGHNSSRGPALTSHDVPPLGSQQRLVGMNWGCTFGRSTKCMLASILIASHVCMALYIEAYCVNLLPHSHFVDV